MGFRNGSGAFLYALSEEARDYHDLLRGLERSWLAARRRGAGRRSTSRAVLAIDVLAAAPLLSATTLARATGLSIKSATVMLAGLVADEVAVEVTHRSARRLFGLAGTALMRDVTIPPRRPEPGRGRGRPPYEREEAHAETLLPPPAAIGRFQWPPVDYSGLDEAIAQAEQVIRSTRHTLDRLSSEKPVLLNADRARPRRSTSVPAMPMSNKATRHAIEAVDGDENGRSARAKRATHLDRVTRCERTRYRRGCRQRRRRRAGRGAAHAGRLRKSASVGGAVCRGSQARRHGMTSLASPDYEHREAAISRHGWTIPAANAAPPCASRRCS